MLSSICILKGCSEFLKGKKSGLTVQKSIYGTFSYLNEGKHCKIWKFNHRLFYLAMCF